MLRRARLIARTGAVCAQDLDDPGQTAAAMLHRHRAMAVNTAAAAAHRHRTLLSARSGHVGRESAKPRQYPRLQGAFMRDAWGGTT